ncbi:uncharacterized protein LOC143888867 [Tasmannia lanceolata]|uniref:uncharacterized protein LOC143888867 n=1 Tax=Tasmannia lanceolata TaxID=3420 RepID=UPI0040649F56
MVKSTLGADSTEHSSSLKRDKMERMGSEMGIAYKENEAATWTIIDDIDKRELMKIGIWNIRGLGADKKILAVKDFIQSRNLDLVAIVESKTMGVTEVLINKIWGRNNREWVAKEAVGSAGGIIIIWRSNSFNLMGATIHQFAISVLFDSVHWNERWMLTIVYGPAKARDRSALWPELMMIRDNWQGPWIVGGDFNTIRFPSEKNRPGRITTSMRHLSNFIQDGQLIDLPLEGSRYTWSNNQESLVKSRIDRILVSKEWEEVFTKIFQRALPKPTSDHNPLLLEISNYSGGPRPFRFDVDLCEIPGFDDKISGWWKELEADGWEGYKFCKN